MRKSIVIFGIILSFILGSLVSAPSVAAPQGEPFVFLEGEIEAIKLLIEELNAKLENVVVKWDNVADKPYEVLHFAQSSTEFLSPHATEAPLDFTLLAKWKIEKDDPNFAHDLLLYDLSIYANIKGNVEIGWYRSVDGTTWVSIRSISFSPVSFTVFQSSDTDSSISSEINYIAFAAANPLDEGSNGEVKDFSGTVTIHLPASESLTRII